MDYRTMSIDGEKFVLVPRAEARRLKLLKPIDAVTFANKCIRENLRAAREHAGLTQTQLARKLGKSQTLISATEGGAMPATAEHLRAVLEACGLPKDWRATEKNP